MRAHVHSGIQPQQPHLVAGFAGLLWAVSSAPHLDRCCFALRAVLCQEFPHLSADTLIAIPHCAGCTWLLRAVSGRLERTFPLGRTVETRRCPTLCFARCISSPEAAMAQGVHQACSFPPVQQTRPACVRACARARVRACARTGA